VCAPFPEGPYFVEGEVVKKRDFKAECSRQHIIDSEEVCQKEEHRLVYEDSDNADYAKLQESYCEYASKKL
jgi:hypothetical protein